MKALCCFATFLLQIENVILLKWQAIAQYVTQNVYRINYYQQLIFMNSVPSYLDDSVKCIDCNVTDGQDSSTSSQEDYCLPPFWNKAFPNFEFKKMIAETQSSLVWLGLQRSSGKTVALKINEIFESSNSEQMHQQKETVFVNQFHLSHMAEIKQVLSGSGYRLMAMTCYPWNLADILKKFTGNTNSRYSEDHQNFVIYAFKSIITAIEELHSHGYVHRDLKLDNFLVNEKLEIFISDFGLITQQGQIDGSLSGTLEYLAPQRLSSCRKTQPISRQVDIWSLGVILYQLFTGETPYIGNTTGQILEQIYEGFIRNKGVPSEAMSLVHDILNIQNSKRLTIQQIKQHSYLQRETKSGEFFISCFK